MWFLYQKITFSRLPKSYSINSSQKVPTHVACWFMCKYYWTIFRREFLDVLIIKSKFKCITVKTNIDWHQMPQFLDSLWSGGQFLKVLKYLNTGNFTILIFFICMFDVSDIKNSLLHCSKLSLGVKNRRHKKKAGR